MAPTGCGSSRRRRCRWRTARRRTPPRHPSRRSSRPRSVARFHGLRVVSKTGLWPTPAVAELRHVGLADDDGAGVLQPLDDDVVLVRHEVVVESATPSTVRMPLVATRSLMPIGTPASGPGSSPAASLRVDRLGRSARHVGRRRAEGVDVRLEHLHPAQRRLGHLDGRELLGPRPCAARSTASMRADLVIRWRTGMACCASLTLAGPFAVSAVRRSDRRRDGPTCRSAAAACLGRRRRWPIGQRPWKRQASGSGSIGLRRAAVQPRCCIAAAGRHRGSRRSARAYRDGAGRRTARPSRRRLDHLAEIHHDHPLAEQAHHVQVVATRRDSSCRAASRRSASSRRITACTDTSSAEVGSSRTSSLGSTAMARAMPTRARWPPESWCG